MDELETLSAIAARLIPSAAPWAQFGRPTVLRPAALPPDLPLELPHPAGSRVIGSCTNGTYHLTILDTRLSPQQVRQFYEHELGRNGWYRHDDQGLAGFLASGESASFRVLFCRGPDGPPLWISATARTPLATELRIEMNTDTQRTPCGRPPGPSGFVRRRGLHDIPLPALPLPPGARSQGGSYGGGPGSYLTTTTIESALDLRSIADYSARQLAEAGWELRRTGETGPVAWSSWSCPNEAGEQVNGFLLAFEQSEHVYALRLERDMSRDARAKADAENREQARTMRRAVAGEYAARVEIEGADRRAAARALHDLILRIEAPIDPNNPHHADPQLIAGRLPDTLPVQLPLPPDSRVLGSLVLGGQTQLYLESRTIPRRILDFYRAQLSAPAWTFFGEARNPGGFTIDETPESISCLFCPTEEGPALELVAHVVSPGVTDLRLKLVTPVSQTPCRDASLPSGWAYSSRQLQLPVLAPPPDADFAGGHGSGSDSHWDSGGHLYTSLDLEAVAQHYGRQFETAGWERRGEGRDELVAWSAWTRRDEEGGRVGALFLAVRQPGTEGYFLLARVYSGF